ncbi:MAG: hypothetical protein R3B93_01280 [Bacteroidia bacterium]
MKKWIIHSSDHALDFISKEYNRLEAFKEGLGERFYDKVETIYSRIKGNPFEFESRTSIYRKGLVNVSKKIQYAVYFRVEVKEVFIDLILPTGINPDLHPSD